MTPARTTIRSWATADSYLGSKSARPLYGYKATQLVRLPHNAIGLKYHATFVVIYHATGEITINSGGYYSRTTKDRINQHTPFQIYQRKGEWLYHVDYTDLPNHLGASGQFTDWLTLDRDGMISPTLTVHMQQYRCLWPSDREHGRII